jgi:hypothetical protein
MFCSVRSRVVVFASALACLVAAPGTAVAQVFDFESAVATFVSPPDASRPGAYTALVMSSGGVTVTITRSSGAAFDIVENSGFQAGLPASWGLHSLDPFFDFTTNDFFIADFSVPVRLAAIQLGDYGGDTDTAFMGAWSGAGGTGALLDSDGEVYDSAFTDIGSMTVATGGAFSINSITFGGGLAGSFPNSLFWDNLEVHASTVPEPASMVLLGAGLPVVGLLMRRKRNRK